MGIQQQQREGVNGGAEVKVPRRSYRRLDAFLDGLRDDVYPEPSSELHDKVTNQMIDHLLDRYPLDERARILDVGCGEGPALRRFRAAGFGATGIALGTDVEHCRRAGLEAFEMDQSFLDFDAGSFHLVWCRHALEHSVFPLYTLSEFRRVLLPNGLLYVEVPAPETCAGHETNPNHYSVFGPKMWSELFKKASFEIAESLELRFQLSIGEDCYYAFFLRRGA